MTYVLWIIQVLLALLFLFTGGMKLVIPPDVLASMGSPNQIPLPGWFVRFIGVCEVLGALGLLLPGLLRIKPSLTPLAAFVAYGRWRAAPHTARREMIRRRTG